MKIDSILCSNFRFTDRLSIIVPKSEVVAFVGPNGSGKSSVLDAIALCLAHIVGRFESPQDKYSIQNSLKIDDIRNGTTRVVISTKISNFLGNPLEIEVSKDIDESGTSFDFKKPNNLDQIRLKLKSDEDPQLPLLVYYRSNRVEAIITEKDDESIYYNKRILGYKNSFNTKRSAFTDFERWFINLENIENEQKIGRRDFEYELIGLKLIRHAITEFLSRLHEASFTNLRVSRKTEFNISYQNKDADGSLFLNKGKDVVKLSQLSSGEKMLIYLVSDIARRLIILNDTDSTSLSRQGIALIDEIGLHLHPSWQRTVLPALRKTFPGVQFIITTHSPQVVSTLSADEIIILGRDQHFASPINPIGRDTNGILEEVFNVPNRPQDVSSKIDFIYELVSSDKIDFDQVHSTLDELRTMVAKEDPILSRLENTIDRIKHR